MTEEQWLEASDAKPMLEFIQVYRDYSAKEWQANYGYPMPPLRILQDRIVHKRFALFSIMCALRNPTVSISSYERAYNATDKYTEVSDELEELIATYEQLSEGNFDTQLRPYPLAIWASFTCEEHNNRQFSDYIIQFDAELDEDDRLLQNRIDRHPIESAAQVKTIHEIFGNPFRPITFDLAWHTSDVMLLAGGIYADRAFDRMPILADALQDAGCNSDDLLSHLRDPNATHVRGCWALDLILGKE